MKLVNIYSFLKKDLQDIEDTLTKTIEAEHPILRETSLQLLRAGGKRIRPVFVLLSAHFGNYKENKKQIKSVAVALELIHMATLVHDDVVDNAELRRGKPTIKHLYGNRVAMYTGDYILARALEVITTVNIPNVHRSLSKTLVKLVEGEITQIEDKYNLNQGLKDYLRRIKRKTALLIATSCKLGAIASGATEKQANQLYRYGYNVGMSFQIIDDILDFTASPVEIGKPTASDLSQGNVTLPVLFAMENEAFSQELQAFFHDKNKFDKNRMDKLISLLYTTDAIERAYTVSNLYLQKALQSIKPLEQNKAKKTLQTIAGIIGKRRS